MAIFKIIDEQLMLMAASKFVGTPNRWLNIAAIADLDNDGTMNIAWVQTTHISGTLRVATIVNGRLQIINEKSGYSNHRIGQTNLCLSVISASAPLKTLYLPTNDYAAVVGLQLEHGKLTEKSQLEQVIDPLKPFHEQTSFGSVLTDGNCIHIP